jgi:hypothetical protein
VDSHSGIGRRSLIIITFPLRSIRVHTLDRPSFQVGEQGSYGPWRTFGRTLCPSQVNHCHPSGSILDGEKHIVGVLAARKSLNRHTEQGMPGAEPQAARPQMVSVFFSGRKMN